MSIRNLLTERTKLSITSTAVHVILILLTEARMVLPRTVSRP